MQRLNSTDTVSRNRLNALAESRSAPDGESAARLLKYYRQQFILSGYCASVPLNRVKAKGFYEEHKSTFDRLTCFFKAHNLDVGRYIRYFAENLDKWEIDIDKELFSKYSLERYHEWLHGIDKRQRIYEWFMKSAKNLAMLCVEGEYISPKDCFIDALKEKKLS